MLSLYYAQIKREFWEHKGVILWYPLVVSAIAISIVLVALFVFGNVEKTVTVKTDGTVSVELDNQTQSNAKPELQLEPQAQDSSTHNLSVGTPDKPKHVAPQHNKKDYRKFAGFLFSMLCMDLAIFAIAIIGNGLAGDRKDGSILFWRSMPVSERDNVLGKYLTALGVMPLFHVVVSVVTIGIISIMIMVAESIYGGSASMSGLSTAVLWDFLQAVLLVPFVLLWLLPFFAWIGFISSFANRLAFLWVIAPFVLVPILEGIFLQSKHFWPAVKQYIDSTMDISDAVLRGNWHDVNLLPGIVGMLLGAGLIYATIYMRIARID
ncbi:hypothetical protein DS2_08787 [Catenovulum agarivorans DS-2]|uniref:Uncharacterized protein n=1 Tax=Catenovulum agarivorans DS-2 TaxID=1328313 RepID=W7QQM0_9ALTE|nr:ABC transporter permease subunit [Catenovulum agarivorans]EWH10183.1 hypothetical protein DS2_08787 [Catenovulum agarivorans DS-2]